MYHLRNFKSRVKTIHLSIPQKKEKGKRGKKISLFSSPVSKMTQIC